MMAACTLWGIVFIVCALVVFVPYFDTTQRKTSAMFLGFMVAGLFGMQSQQGVAELIAVVSAMIGACGYMGKGVQV